MRNRSAGVPRRVLWFTPTAPNRVLCGREAYSAGLIEAVSGLTGMDVTVHPVLETREELRSTLVKARSLLSTHPAMSAASRLPGNARAALARLDDEWDLVVIEHLQLGWLADAAHARSLPYVYVSQNYESGLRRPSLRDRLKVVPQALDWVKVRKLERRVIRRATVVTAITEEDAALLRSEGAPSVVVIPPVATRPVAAERDLRSTDRAVLHFGSFDWSGKAENLREFITAADPIFSRAGVKLVIAGSGNADRLFGPAGPPPFIEYLGLVDEADVPSVFARCRAAVVVEPRGGGFKMKVLDMIAGRLPLFVLEGSANGISLNDGQNCRIASTLQELVRTCVFSLDDVSGLEHLVQCALADLQDFSLEAARERLTVALDPAPASNVYPKQRDGVESRRDVELRRVM